MCFKEELLGAGRGAREALACHCFCYRNASTLWKSCWWLKLLQRRWVGKKWTSYEYLSTAARKWRFWQGCIKSPAVDVFLLCFLVLPAHTALFTAATGFSKEAAIASSAPPCMHGLLKTNEFLRSGNASVVDSRRKRGFAIASRRGDISGCFLAANLANHSIMLL